MSKATRNYILAFMMVLLGLFEGVSGFVLWLVLPQGGGYRGGRGLASEAIFLWTRDTWIDLHNWVGVALLFIVLVHIILHWRWIVHMTKTYFKQKAESLRK